MIFDPQIQGNAIFYGFKMDVRVLVKALKMQDMLQSLVY